VWKEHVVGSPHGVDAEPLRRLGDRQQHLLAVIEADVG
jgi:hypothetical protein